MFVISIAIAAFMLFTLGTRLAGNGWGSSAGYGIVAAVLFGLIAATAVSPEPQEEAAPQDVRASE